MISLLQRAYFPSYALILLSFCFGPVRGDGSTNTSLPGPLSIPPSLDWYASRSLRLLNHLSDYYFCRDGNDGKWSSFAIQIGTPPQAVRLFPSTGGQSIWAVLPIGCDESEGSDCPNSRGNTFNPNESTTWEEQGLYKLPLSPQHYLPYSGNAKFGFDNITASLIVSKVTQCADA
jgi:hypothetical protein